MNTKNKTTKASGKPELPAGYHLTTWVDGTGKTWMVEDIVNDTIICRGAKTPEKAIEIALRKIGGAA